MSSEQLPHLFVDNFFATEKYTAAPRKGPDFRLPARDRSAQGTTVRDQLNKIRGENETSRGVTTPPESPAPIIVDVRGEQGFLLKLESLENRAKGITVANSRVEAGVPVATVHVPEGALTYFLKLADQYLTEETKGGETKPPRPRHQELIDGIAELRLATLRSFWTDSESDFPVAGEKIWWEVWVLAHGEQSPWPAFRVTLRANELVAGQDTIRFPDREVGLVYGTAEQLSASVELLDMIGEVRRAKESPTDFISLPPKDHADFSDWLRRRVTPPGVTAPVVCLLDSGTVINPLIGPALALEDCYRYDPSWPLADERSTHGTEMAGVALYGSSLADLLRDGGPVALQHRLESVRILPPPPHSNEPRLYGYITAQAAYRVEIARPDRLRSFCMAVTSDGRDAGRPSSWSGVVDQLCVGLGDENPRLFFISAGNTDPGRRHLYPDSNITDSIQDPAQAWNAVTVGAYTGCFQFDEEKFPGFRPLAARDGVSPCSTTSLSWDSAWPYKPDIVLEGGNQIVQPGTSRVADPDDMAMLTTAHAATGRLLVDFRDTSAATAQAARMAAIIQAEYPHLWPETVRALLIHSAEWTEPMREAFGRTKADAASRLRFCGYGVPDLNRALYSARSSLTLVAQQTIAPFVKEGGDVKTRDMALHALPWPAAQLLELGDQQVTMRVTLSYFVEPKPGRRDGFATARHRYQSHGLRFEVRRPQESLEDLRKRVSQAAREEEEKYEAVGDTGGWAIGPKARTRGSVHSDWWTGTAAELANCGHVIVYPVSGWWRESRGKDWMKEARYALVVSIRTTGQRVGLFAPVGAAVDLYTPVAEAVAAAVRPAVATEVPIDG